MLETEALREADRLMTVCNACRYCEGLCAVFPAMEMRRTFLASDLHYLANLCHQCGACYSDCQYSPPHEFAVNVPATFAKVRRESYGRYAWPRAFAGVFDRNGLLVTSLAAAGVSVFVIGFVAAKDPAVLYGTHAGDFYKVMPHNVMAALFGAVAIYAILALALSVRAFWRCINSSPTSLGAVSIAEATHDAARLRYLGGGGGGCTSESERPSTRRRIFHHLTFYGFLFCFAATCIATIYHYAFGWHAPYPLVSLPVILGTLGGIGLLCGPAGLFVLSQRRDPMLTDPSRTGMDTAFIIMLFLTSLTGFGLMVFRDTGAMGVLLAVHLGVVLALFLSLPYGKFVHGFFRYAALIRYAGERRTGKVRRLDRTLIYSRSLRAVCARQAA
ncbi:MAG: tricarballylate utilization 4Fe-4S protein TcuB [Pseudolabrys sp.]